MAKKKKLPKQKQKQRLLKNVYVLIEHYEMNACTKEAQDKFAEIVVAENGLYDRPDEIVVMGYFDPIEGYVLGGFPAKPTDKFTYDFSMESLGSALRKLGVKTTMESDLALDERTKKLVQYGQSEAF